MSKSEYARHRGVTPAAISNFISRGRLTAPALRPDGLVDAELADQQLGATVDPVMSASATARNRAPHARPAAPSSAEVVDMSSARQLLAARASLAETNAERARRELAHQTGRYMLTETASLSWTKHLAGLLQGIELGFADLGAAAGLDRAQMAALRKWWHDLRARTAKEAAAAAATEPEYVTDPTRSRRR